MNLNPITASVITSMDLFIGQKINHTPKYSKNILTSMWHVVNFHLEKGDFQMEEQCYDFSAIKGIQAGREYFVVMCPFKLIPRLFLFDEEELSPELRAQRTLNKARIPEIANYLVENPKDYCFSAITASVDGELEFNPFNEDELGRNVGHLKIGMSSTFIVNDGQHRRAAIEQALSLDRNLGTEKICVVLFVDRGLKRCQQMFADLNKHAVRPSGSLGVLYEHREPLAELSRKLTLEVDVFKDMVEMEKTSISNRSRKLFTLNSLYYANKALLGKGKKNSAVSKQEDKIVLDFWNNVTNQFTDWKLVKERKANPSELRKDYVHSHGVLLRALGIVGHSLLTNHSTSWKRKILKLKNINWRRENTTLWEGRAMVGGRMTASPTNLLLTSAIIKHELNLKLTPEEERLEQQFLNR